MIAKKYLKVKTQHYVVLPKITYFFSLARVAKLMKFLARPELDGPSSVKPNVYEGF